MMASRDTIERCLRVKVMMGAWVNVWPGALIRGRSVIPHGGLVGFLHACWWVVRPYVPMAWIARETVGFTVHIPKSASVDPTNEQVCACVTKASQRVK